MIGRCKKMKSMIIIGGSFFLFSCASVPITLCPSYPVPSQEVLSSIQTLADQEVDAWMEEQFKLNQKLKVCNGIRIQPEK